MKIYFCDKIVSFQKILIQWGNKAMNECSGKELVVYICAFFLQLAVKSCDSAPLSPRFLSKYAKSYSVALCLCINMTLESHNLHTIEMETASGSLHDVRDWKNYSRTWVIMPHGMCYSHFGNGVRNGAISITQWGFMNDCCKVNPVVQWGNFLVTTMGFVDNLGLGHLTFVKVYFHDKVNRFWVLEVQTWSKLYRNSS